jgi:N-acetylglucosaminyldiphosphoundecaprenol N-acetyl-beta-D-mannosaminyltransferase
MASAQLAQEPGGKAPDSGAGGAARKRRTAARRGGAIASRRVLGMRVDATTYAETADAVIERAESGAGGMVCIATAHMAIECLDDPALRRAVNSADRVTPDGMSLVWALRRMGVDAATRVYGPSLLPILCARAEARGLALGFYGGTPEVLDALQAELRRRFPSLKMPFAWSPPFRALDPAEDAAARDAIEASGVRILFVGLGCPKQERWMAEHRDALPCVLVGVGAAFDFLSGAKAQAPEWMQGAGLEWLFRLGSEPRRLWRRYLVGNTRFLYHFVLRGNRG